MFFDDQAPARQVSALCSLACGACSSAAPPGAPLPPPFPTLSVLSAHLEKAHKQHLCAICLAGRKVFVSQQQRYSRSALERHQAGGSADAGNELGAAGFRGHPLCAFCGVRFYGDGELYTHMQREHYTCFLCVRAAPESSSPTYFRRYEELENHFRAAHALCEHPGCLAKKFVAFSGANELRRHAALEHGGALSAAQKRDALRIEVAFSVRGAHDGPMAGAPAMPPQRQGGGRGGAVGREVAAAAERASREAAMRAAARAAAGADALPQPPPPAPAPTPAESAGRAAGAVPLQMTSDGMGPRWAAAAGSGGRLPGGDDEAFPALPPAARGAARKQAARIAADAAAQRSMASRLGGGAPSLLVAAMGAPRMRPPPPPFPELGAASSGDALGSGDAARAANAALVRRVRDALPLVTRDEDFERFRALSAAFRDGTVPASLYYDDVAALGLAPLLPELAALLPDAGKRAALLAAAQQARASAPAGHSGAAGNAAAAARVAAMPPAALAARRIPWQCGACTLQNAAHLDACAACGGARRRDDAENGNPLAAALEAAMLGAKRGKGGKKQQGQQQMAMQEQAPQRAYAPAPPRLPTPPAAMPAAMESAFPPLPAAAPRRPRPGNVWTHSGGGAPTLRQGAKR
jgi:hypothetical protein